MSETTLSMTPRAPWVNRRATTVDGAQLRTCSEQKRVATAVVYCKANLGPIDGKICLLCGKVSYSRGGIHPQCAVILERFQISCSGFSSN